MTAVAFDADGVSEQLVGGRGNKLSIFSTTYRTMRSVVLGVENIYIHNTH